MGPLARIRTGTIQFLRLLPLPVGLQADTFLLYNEIVGFVNCGRVLWLTGRLTVPGMKPVLAGTN